MDIVNSVRLCGYPKHLPTSTDIPCDQIWPRDGRGRRWGVALLLGLGLGLGLTAIARGSPKNGSTSPSHGSISHVESAKLLPLDIQDCERWEPTWPPAQPEARLHEMSGLVHSTLDKDLLYHVTDSGNDPVIFVTDFAGKILSTLRYRAAAWDVEALSKGPCPWGGACVFPGDIGDNLRWRVVKRIDAVEEKAIFGGPMRAESVEFKLPDQLVLDMEALAVHPLTGDIFLFSKEPKRSRVFRLPVTVWRQLDVVHVPEFLGEIQQNRVADVAFSRDGSRILVTSTKGVFERSEEPRLDTRPVGGWYPHERNLKLPQLDQQEGVTYLGDDMSVAYSSEKKILRPKNWGIVVAPCQPRHAGANTKK